MAFDNTIGMAFRINADSSQATSELKKLRSQIASDTKGIADEGGNNINQFGNSFTNITPKLSSLSVAIGNIYAQLAQQLVQGLKAGAAAVLDYSSKLEQVAISFRTLTGSATATQKLLKDIQDFAKATPFEFSELAGLSQKLLAANVEAKNVVPLLKDVGNAVSAVGGSQEDLNGVVRALTQIIGKGKVSAEEINQLAERNINGFKILAVELGKTEAEVRKLAEEGRISSQVFVEAFQRFSQTKFGDAMAEQSKTFAGSMSNIKDALLQVASTAFQPLYKEISGLALRFSNDVQAQGNDFRAVGNVIAKYVGEGLIAGLEAVIGGLGSYIGTRLGEVFTKGEVVDSIVLAFTKGLSDSAERVYTDLFNKLGYLTRRQSNQIVPQVQSGNYLNPEDQENRLPGYTADSYRKPLTLVDGDDAKKAAEKAAAELIAARQKLNDATREQTKLAFDELTAINKKNYEEGKYTAERFHEEQLESERVYTAKLIELATQRAEILIAQAKNQTDKQAEQQKYLNEIAQIRIDSNKRIEADADLTERVEKKKTDDLKTESDKRVRITEAEAERRIALEKAATETRIAEVERDVTSETKRAEAIGSLKVKELEYEKSQIQALEQNEETKQRIKLLDEAIAQARIAFGASVVAAINKETEAEERKAQAIRDGATAGPAATAGAAGAPGTPELGGVAGGLANILGDVFGDTTTKIQDQADILKAVYSDIAGASKAAIGSMVVGLGQLVSQWITTGKFSAKAALQMVSGIATGLAIEAGLKALMQYAEGVALAANPFTAYLAPGHFAAATAYGVAAAAAGAVGLGTGLASRAFGSSSTASSGVGATS